MKLLGQISARLIAYLLVVAVGLTTIFFVPRFAPADPIEAMLAKVSSQGSYMSAAQTDALRAIPGRFIWPERLAFESVWELLEAGFIHR